VQANRILVAMAKQVSIRVNSTALYYAVIEYAATLRGTGVMLADLRRHRCIIASGYITTGGSCWTH
jgi:hypothetical protein